VNSVLTESQEEGLSQCSRSLELAMKLTSDGARELDILVNELHNQVKENRRWRGKITAVKVVLMKDQVKKLKSRLKSCSDYWNLPKNANLSEF
jgi:hypothetical protein